MMKKISIILLSLSLALSSAAQCYQNCEEEVKGFTIGMGFSSWGKSPALNLELGDRISGTSLISWNIYLSPSPKRGIIQDVRYTHYFGQFRLYAGPGWSIMNVSNEETKSLPKEFPIKASYGARYQWRMVSASIGRHGNFTLFTLGLISPFN